MVSVSFYFEPTQCLIQISKQQRSTRDVSQPETHQFLILLNKFAKISNFLSFVYNVYHSNYTWFTTLFRHDDVCRPAGIARTVVRVAYRLRKHKSARPHLRSRVPNPIKLDNSAAYLASPLLTF